MNGILALCIQDTKRLLTNALFWVITVTLVLIILLVNFALPDSLGENKFTIVSYNVPQVASFTTIANSEDELRELVQSGDAIGLIKNDSGEITVVHTGLSDKTIRSVMQSLSPSNAEVRSEKMNDNKTIIPFNKRMTPVFVCFEALIVGFILGGALMLSEKQEGNVKAMRISPVTVNRYLVSKTLLFSVVGTLYAMLLTVFCVGINFNWIQFIVLNLFGSALFTLIGLAFTSLFRDMSGWFFSAALLLAVNMATGISYSSPSFSPIWMRFIPSYPILFAYEDVLFGNGFTASTMLQIGLWCIGMYIVAYLAVHRFVFLKGGFKA